MEWISVNDRMPKNGQIVFVCTSTILEQDKEFFAPMIMQYRSNNPYSWRKVATFENGEIMGWDRWLDKEDVYKILYWSPINKPKL